MQRARSAGGAPARGDLDELLAAALEAAVAVAEVARRRAVADDLHLDVPGAGQQPLDVDVAVAERRRRLRARSARTPPASSPRSRTGRMPRPPPPATALTMTAPPGPSDAGSPAASARSIGPSVAGQDRQPHSAASARARTLSPNSASVSGSGPTKVSPASAHRRAKLGVLGQEPVAGVHGVAVRRHAATATAARRRGRRPDRRPGSPTASSARRTCSRRRRRRRDGDRRACRARGGPQRCGPRSRPGWRRGAPEWPSGGV